MIAINDIGDDTTVGEIIGLLYLTGGQQVDTSSSFNFPILRHHFGSMPANFLPGITPPAPVQQVSIAVPFPVVFRHQRCDVGTIYIYIYILERKYIICNLLFRFL